MTRSSLSPDTAEPFVRAAGWNGRIAGLDLARALALIGMFAAHIGDAGTRGPEADGWSWLWIADGRSSAVFAVLAGVTISLMTAKDPSGRAHAAVRVAVRGAVLVLAGYALDALGTPVDVILTNLGLMFLLVIPGMCWRVRTLAVVGVGVLVAGGIVFPFVEDLGEGIPIVEKFASHHYPALAWAGYLLVGMAVGRLPLRETRAAARLASWGAVIAAIAYGAGLASGGTTPWAETGFGTPDGPAWASVAPHSNTAFELVGNVGVALLVIGVCVLAVRPSRWTFPLLAFGSMSLTMYTAHIVVIAIVGDASVWRPSNVALVALTVTLVAAASVWRATAGAGPLERGLTRVSGEVADATVGTQRTSGSTG